MQSPSSSDLFHKLYPPRQRFIMAVFLGSGLLLCYSTLLSFDQTKIHMAISPYVYNSSNICKFNVTRHSYVTLQEKPYRWNKVIDQHLDDAVFYLNVVTHLVAGPVLVRYDPKKVVTWCASLTGLFTFSVPLFLFNAHSDFILLLIYRLVMGGAVGMVFPAIHTVLSNWAPARERGTLAGILFSMLQLGPALKHEFSEYLVAKTNNPKMIFYVFGGMTSTWAAVWCYAGKSNYEESRSMTQRERAYLRQSMRDEVYFGPKKIPWLKVCKSGPVWALVVASIGHGVLWEIILYTVPFYMEVVLGYDTDKSKFALETLVYVISSGMILVVGIFTDWVINGGYILRTTTRKIYTTAGAMGPAFFLMAALFAGCRISSLLLLIVFAISLITFYFSGTRMNTLDLAPNFSGLVQGLAHGLELFAGWATHIASDLVTDQNNTPAEWKQLFGGLLIIMSSTNLVFVLFGSAEVQSWNYVADERKEVGFEEDNYDEEEYSLSEFPQSEISSR